MDTPVNSNGEPLVKIQVAAAELVPTGQYSNVSIGPVQITMWIDPDEKELDSKRLANIAQQVNQAAFVIEKDVVAVQRNLVLQSMQEALDG
jgi:hypothetical protein